MKMKLKLKLKLKRLRFIIHAPDDRCSYRTRNNKKSTLLKTDVNDFYLMTLQLYSLYVYISSNGRMTVKYELQRM
jgi:hypothetical protein